MGSMTMIGLCFSREQRRTASVSSSASIIHFGKDVVEQEEEDVLRRKIDRGEPTSLRRRLSLFGP